jgi:hypothetical protein
MGPQLGHDLGDVRVHTDTRAAEAARSVDARAYTLGRDVVFGAGEYAPETHEGRHLLAHELTHVAQQSRGATQPQRQSADVGTPGDPLEREANRTADAVIGGGAAPPITQSAGPTLQRQPAGGGGPTDAGAPGGTTAPVTTTPAGTGGTSGATAAPGGTGPEIRQGRLGDIVVVLPNWTIFDAYSKAKHWGDGFKDVKLAKILIPELVSTVDLIASGGAGADFAFSLGPGILKDIHIGLSYGQAALVLGGSLVGAALMGGYPLVGGIAALLLLGEFRGLAQLEIRGRISLDANIHAELKAAAEVLGAFEVGYIAAGLGARAGASFDVKAGGTVGLYYQDRHLKFRYSESLKAQLKLLFSLYAYIKASLLGATWTQNWDLVKKDLGIEWQVGSELQMSYDNGLTINIPEIIEGAQKAADFASKMINADTGAHQVMRAGPGGPGKGGVNPPPPGPPLGPGGATPSTAPTGMSRGDPIDMIWVKPLGRYRNPVWLMGTPYYRDGRQKLATRNRWIGVPNWPGRDSIVRRVTTPRGRAADDFKVALEEDGFDDWDAYSPDHVTDLMFEGEDDFPNLWPLDRGTNSRAGTWHWGQGVWFSNPGDPTVRREAIGSTTLDGRYFRIKQIADPPG